MSDNVYRPTGYRRLLRERFDTPERTYTRAEVLELMRQAREDTIHRMSCTDEEILADWEGRKP